MSDVKSKNIPSNSHTFHSSKRVTAKLI